MFRAQDRLLKLRPKTTSILALGGGDRFTADGTHQGAQ